MEKDEKSLIQLRDCFTGGYTLPQYCIDNGIKKPLIVSEKKFYLFVWDIYVQFRYDKRLTAQFSFIDNLEVQLNYSAHHTVAPLKTKSFSEEMINDFDKVIVLSSDKNLLKSDKAIYLNELLDYFCRKTYYEIPLLNFLQRYPYVKLFVTKFPDKIAQYEGGAEFEKKLPTTAKLRDILVANQSGTAKTKLDKFGYTNQEVLEMLLVPKINKNPDGTTPLRDAEESSLRPIKNGKRITANQPSHFQNRIYFVGTCHFFGINAPLDKTIESYLQEMLNENNLPYRVENEGQHYWGRHQDTFYNLNALNPSPSDIIFILVLSAIPKNLPIFDISHAFDPPLDYRDIFVEKKHINETGYKILAEKYFEFLTANNFFRDKEFVYPSPSQPPHRYGIPPQFEAGGVKTSYGAELDAYKKILRAKKLPVGAIVMNCNPFTLGHQYLVEYAAAKVVRLYIFVVEEYRSEFPFKDMIELVRQGVKDFPNVEVLPSGKFIRDKPLDSSEDVEIFAKEIAPELGITIRFAGEEPTDNVTRQYNETMKRILPQYGIEFCEIPRKVLGEEIISASKVREALHVGDFDKIKKLVPAMTLEYLRWRHQIKK